MKKKKAPAPKLKDNMYSKVVKGNATSDKAKDSDKSKGSEKMKRMKRLEGMKM